MRAHQEVAGRAVDQDVQPAQLRGGLPHPLVAVLTLAHISLGIPVGRTPQASVCMHVFDGSYPCFQSNPCGGRRRAKSMSSASIQIDAHWAIVGVYRLGVPNQCTWMPMAWMPSCLSAATASSSTCCLRPLIATAAPCRPAVCGELSQVVSSALTEKGPGYSQQHSPLQQEHPPSCRVISKPMPEPPPVMRATCDMPIIRTPWSGE